jgi:Zn-dependent membrane protease YugP
MDPRRIFLSCFVGVILILAGVCLLVNKKARIAATSLGLTILLTVLGDLPADADAPRRAYRRGCAELFLRHTTFLRSRSAVGELD